MGKVLIVGAGLSGATIARLYAESGETVIVYDKRDTIGGNVYDKKDKNNLPISPYGAHIFHTNSKAVFDFLSKFTEWQKYEHIVKARIKNKNVPVPFNLNSIDMLYSPEKAEKLKKLLIEKIGENKQISIMKLRKSEDAEIQKFAEFVYKNVYYDYTIKLWGVKPKQLKEGVMDRVPVRISYNDVYFTDKYQYMPKNGFGEMVFNMLKHPNIQLQLNKDANNCIKLKDGKIYLDGVEFDGKLIYTGSIDQLFDYQFGVLPYRSLKFKRKTVRKPSYLDCAELNYTTSKKWISITEFNKFYPDTENSENKYCVISKKFVVAYKPNKNIAYYPIPLEKNYEIYNKYLEESKKYENLYLIGRLATYKNSNISETVLNAVSLFNKIKDE